MMYQPRTLLVACAIVALVILLATGRGYRIITGEMPSDLRTDYLAGLAFGKNGNIYDHRRLVEVAAKSGVTTQVWPYVYPPPLALCFSALSRLGMAGTTRVWLSLSTIAGITVVLLSLGLVSNVVRFDSDRRRLWRCGLALVLCGVLPFGNNLRVGQVNLLVLASILGALVLSMRHRDIAAGALLAPAAAIKVTPAGLLVFFVLQRRPRVLLGFLIGLVVLVTPTLLTADGVESWRQFLSFAPRLGYGREIPGLFPAAAEFNFSIAGFLARLSSNTSMVSWASWIGVSLLGAVVAAQHLRYRKDDAGLLLLGPYMILMVIGPPLTYVHHVVYVYPGLLVTMSGHAALGWRSIALRLIMLALAGLASIDFPVLYDRFGLTYPLLRSINLYALIALFVLGVIGGKGRRSSTVGAA